MIAKRMKQLSVPTPRAHTRRKAAYVDRVEAACNPRLACINSFPSLPSMTHSFRSTCFSPYSFLCILSSVPGPTLQIQPLLYVPLLMRTLSRIAVSGRYWLAVA